MNDSLIEIALREMKAKRKPRTLAKIAKDVFEVKGISAKESEKILSQFQIDFMLSGYFICCGEDKNGVKLWDLKTRQPSSLLDKDGNYLEDLYNDDEEVVKNELNDDTVYKQTLEKDFDDEYYDVDEDEDEENDEEDHDDIEEELMSEGIGVDDDNDDADENIDVGEDEDLEYDEEDEVLEDNYDDTDLSHYEDDEDENDVEENNIEDKKI